MKRAALLLAVIMLWIQHGTAQTSIGISSFQWNGPQTANYGDFSMYNYAVKNYGPGTINSPITIYTAVMDSSNALDTIKTDNTTLAQITLQPYDSVWVYDTTLYTPVNFKVGATVVVIWPVAAGATVQNNASYTIYIEDSTMTVIEVSAPNAGTVYPNPATDRITITPPANGKDGYVEQVRIFDRQGRLVLARSGTGTLDISILPPEIYTIEVIQSDDTRSVYKIVKREP